jgi:hypothetical protein
MQQEITEVYHTPGILLDLTKVLSTIGEGMGRTEMQIKCHDVLRRFPFMPVKLFPWTLAKQPRGAIEATILRLYLGHNDRSQLAPNYIAQFRTLLHRTP